MGSLFGKSQSLDIGIDDIDLGELGQDQAVVVNGKRWTERELEDLYYQDQCMDRAEAAVKTQLADGRQMTKAEQERMKVDLFEIEWGIERQALQRIRLEEIQERRRDERQSEQLAAIQRLEATVERGNVTAKVIDWAQRHPIIAGFVGTDLLNRFRAIVGR